MASGNANIRRADAESPESSTSQSEWAQGWKIVVVALATYVLGATGMFFAFGLFFKPLSSFPRVNPISTTQVPLVSEGSSQ